MRAIKDRPMKFSELFEGVTSRSEVVVTFLALLELIRLKQIVAFQREAFGEIEICRGGPEVNSAEATAAAEPAPSS
jgi:segregation and condensation protein A